MSYSVIISSAGRAAYLIELLNSIYSQTVKPAEIIVLLDDDETSIACRDQILSLPHADNISVGLCYKLNLPAKRNYGAKIATQDVILYSDDDDLWHPLRAEKVIHHISNGNWAVCHNYSCFGIYKKANCSLLGVNSRVLNLRTLCYADNVYGGGSSIACRKKLLEYIPFDESLLSCEDFDWWIRVQFAKFPIYYDGDDLVSYRRHQSNMGNYRSRMFKYLFVVGSKSFSDGLLRLAIGSLICLKSIILLIR